MKNQQTPGPWYRHSLNGENGIATRASNGSHDWICSLENGVNPEADGDLIAAAPDMLWALEQCDRLAGCQSDKFEDLSLAIGEVRAICRGIIAKAKGKL